MGSTRKILLILLLGMATFQCWAQPVTSSGRTGRIARITVGNLVFSNWDTPCLTLDTCLDMTLTRISVPDVIEWNGRKYPVVEIGPGSLRGCKNLTYLEVQQYIGAFLKGALLECPNLRVIKINRKEPTALAPKHPFYGCNWDGVIEPYHTLSTVIVVPEGCVEAYRNAEGWKEFKTIQSHEPDGSEIKMDKIDVRINQLESELTKAQQTVDRIKQELEVLRKTKEYNNDSR